MLGTSTGPGNREADGKADYCCPAHGSHRLHRGHTAPFADRCYGDHWEDRPGPGRFDDGERNRSELGHPAYLSPIYRKQDKSSIAPPGLSCTDSPPGVDLARLPA